MNEGFAVIEKASGSANLLGSLSPAAIWALVTIAFAAYIIYINRQHREYDKEWQDVRVKNAEAVTRMADALNNLTGKVRDLEMRLLCLTCLKDTKIG